MEDIKIQVCLFAFDCLYRNGDMLLQRPLSERREALRASVSEKSGELQFAVFKARISVPGLAPSPSLSAAWHTHLHRAHAAGLFACCAPMGRALWGLVIRRRT